MDTSTPRSPTVADNVAASPVPVDDRIAKEVLISSSWGPKGSSAIIYPTLAAVHVYSRLMLSISYHSYANKDRSCLYLTPSTYLRIAIFPYTLCFISWG